MTSAVTVLLNYSADGLRKLSVPSQTVNPGETVKIYLWAKTRADLDGYDLRQGPDTLGRGVLRQYPGQIEEQYFELAGDGALQDFDWPVVSLASVTAYGNLYADIDGAVSLVALPGEDVTRLFKLSGNSLARNVEAGAPKLFGTVRARSNRAPWCLEWAWTVPGGGVTVADNYDFGRTPLLYFDASVIAAGEGQVLTSLADRLGNLITLSGSLRNWFVPGDTEEESYEPWIYNGEYSIWHPFGGKGNTAWSGVIPNDALLQYCCDSFFYKTSEGKHSIRLSASVIKRKRWGLLWIGYSPYMACKAVYSSCLTKTLFVIASGCKSYAIGKTVNGESFRPVGYSQREEISMVLGGDSADRETDGSNLGAIGSGETEVSLALTAFGGSTYSSFLQKEYTSELYWAAIDNTGYSRNNFAVIGKYPAAIPKLITVELNANTNVYNIYQNGILVETLPCVEDMGKFSIFPVSVLRFSAAVDHYNNIYDTMGVRYQTHQDIYTALLFDGLFDTAKRQAIEAYLMAKWGIAA